MVSKKAKLQGRIQDKAFEANVPPLYSKSSTVSKFYSLIEQSNTLIEQSSILSYN